MPSVDLPGVTSISGESSQRMVLKDRLCSLKALQKTFVLRRRSKVSVVMGSLMPMLAVHQAAGDFTMSTNFGKITITGYSGAVTNLVIPGATNGYPVVGIGTNAFYGRSSITNIIFPNSVTDIASYSFSGCSNLKRISLGSGLSSIGAYASVLLRPLLFPVFGRNFSCLHVASDSIFE